MLKLEGVVATARKIGNPFKDSKRSKNHESESSIKHPQQVNIHWLRQLLLQFQVWWVLISESCGCDDFWPNNLEVQDLSESNSDGDGGEHLSLIEESDFPEGCDISSGSEDDSFNQARG